MQVIKHPLIDHYLGRMRDKETSSPQFRAYMRLCGQVAAAEVLKSLPLISTEISTPLQSYHGFALASPMPLFIPILRAGYYFMQGALDLCPDADVAFVAAKRNEETLAPDLLYSKVPKNLDRQVFVFDPMLATGGSAIASFDYIKSLGAKNLTYVSLLASPEGIYAFEKAHPDVQLYTCAVDDCLNDQGFIVPGLGDAGDRCFG